MYHLLSHFTYTHHIRVFTGQAGFKLDVREELRGLWLTSTPLSSYFTLKGALLEVTYRWKAVSARETTAGSHLARFDVHAGKCKRNICVWVREAGGARLHLPDFRCHQTSTRVPHMSRRGHIEDSS